MSDSIDIIIKKNENSRIHELNKSSIGIGKQYADHMLVCDFEDGQWKTPEILPYGDFSLSPATSCLHYGQAIFEGVKAYRHADGSVVVFRPIENYQRLNKSAVRMDMPTVPEAIFMEGLRKLIALDAAWVPDMPESTLYIRPFLIATDAFIGVRTSDNYRFSIITSPAGPYYDHPVKIFVQDKFVRAVKGGIGFTKAAGNYGASMYPTHQVKNMGYDQILWTDSVEHKYVQEIGTMNVFFIIDGKAITPDLNDGTILAGVTRKSIIQLFEDNNIPVEERPISIDELVAAHRAGKLQEAFGSGTAASMSFIAELTYNDETLKLPAIEDWKISPMIKKELDDIRYGRIEDRHGWLFKVN